MVIDATKSSHSKGSGSRKRQLATQGAAEKRTPPLPPTASPEEIEEAVQRYLLGRQRTGKSIQLKQYENVIKKLLPGAGIAGTCSILMSDFDLKVSRSTLCKFLKANLPNYLEKSVKQYRTTSPEVDASKTPDASASTDRAPAQRSDADSQNHGAAAGTFDTAASPDTSEIPPDSKEKRNHQVAEAPLEATRKSVLEQIAQRPKSGHGLKNSPSQGVQKKQASAAP